MSTPTKENAPSSETARSTALIGQKDNTQPNREQPSWRDFYEPHPSALAFHKFTTDDQRCELREDLKINNRLQKPDCDCPRRR